MTLTRWPALIAGLIMIVGGLGPQKTPAAVQTADSSSHRALVNQYCVSCHNERLRTAGLALDTVNVENVAQNPEVWEKVARKVRGRVMPPVGRPRPDENTYDAFASYLETSLDRAAALQPNPGRTDTFHRMNRTEYKNTIRDLLALDVDVSSLLPLDDGSYGFDNVGVGGLTPTLMERYLSAAQKISRLAIGRPVRSPGGETLTTPSDLTQDNHIAGLPFGTRGGATFSYNFPVDGEYEIQLRLTRDRDERVEGLLDPHQLELILDGARLELFTITPPRGQQVKEADADLNIRVPVKAGPHEVAAAFLKRPSALVETENQPYQASFEYVFHRRTQPALHSISILGPYAAGEVGDTPSRRRIFMCRPAAPSEEASCAHTIISTIARRAYRRDVSDADIQAPLAFFKEVSAEEGFEAGIEMALRTILVSPEFLFRIDQDPPNVAEKTPYRISDTELASRLSAFLWSSIPDDELLDLANRGKLKDPAVLQEQVLRMLADSRARSLVTNFAGQWLHLRSLASTIPDLRAFPDFDDNLRQAFRQETELFFESIVKEDRNVFDLLTANYTFLNERLARHYGIPNIYGSRFRRITFEPGSVRSGLLGQGSILTVTSYATRTSPVLRGKWLLENILGTPPPPPPPNVPPLKESNSGGIALSMRQRMAEHRSNPVCASCHQIMDPLGFAMENFDAIGRWRNQDETGQSIDASGSLPDGSTFQGVDGLRNALMKHPEAFVTTFTEKLLTYALGRGLDYYDAPAVRKIVRDAGNGNDRFSSIVLGVVTSTPFQMRSTR